LQNHERVMEWTTLRQWDNGEPVCALRYIHTDGALRVAVAKVVLSFNELLFQAQLKKLMCGDYLRYCWQVICSASCEGH
jgi:hypothetical protein